MKDLLKIVYEDEDLLVANKPPGILVDRPLSEETSLSDLVASYAQRSVRPLHRLDRDTSGLVMFALNAKWNRYFSELFEKKRVRKAYWAIVKGDWDGRITKIDTNIAPVPPLRPFEKWIQLIAILGYRPYRKREERIRYDCTVWRRDIRS